MRADARRNREKLLHAASALFSTSDEDVSLDAVARRAGVGIGTLYRHFPTRDALVEAAYRNEVAQLCDAAAELLETHPPDVALAEWMERFVRYAATKRGMGAALRSVVAGGTDLFAQTRAQIIAAVTRLLDAAVAAGTVRPDVGADDVLQALGAIWLVTDDAAWPDKPLRLVRLLMDGLRYGAGADPPARA